VKADDALKLAQARRVELPAVELAATVMRMIRHAAAKGSTYIEDVFEIQLQTLDEKWLTIVSTRDARVAVARYLQDHGFRVTEMQNMLPPHNEQWMVSWGPDDLYIARSDKRKLLPRWELYLPVEGVPNPFTNSIEETF
jgi:hypothetical protein